MLSSSNNKQLSFDKTLSQYLKFHNEWYMPVASRNFCFFFFFEKWILADKLIKKREKHQIQKTLYLMEHSPTRFERIKIVSLVGLRRVLLHCLANLHERKKYSKKSLIVIKYPWWYALLKSFPYPIPLMN